MLNAQAALDLGSLMIVHGGRDSFSIGRQVRAVAAQRIIEDLQPSLRLEPTDELRRGERALTCLAGERWCPPEDCGGS
jgi:hypothetical protein